MVAEHTPPRICQSVSQWEFHHWNVYCVGWFQHGINIAQKPGRRSSILVVLAGFILATAVTVHIFLAFLIPLAFAWYVFRSKGISSIGIITGLAWLTLGALLALSLFGSINAFILGGRFDYFMPQVTASVENDLFSEWNRPI